MSIVENIRSLCKKCGISIPKVEKELGFGNGAIYNWDKNSPSIDKLQKVANYFKVSIDYLLGRGDIYDRGWVLKEERESQGLSEKELGNLAGLDEFEILQYESDEMPITEDLAENISKALGMSFVSLLNKHGLYDEHIPPEFDGDVDAYEAFKKAVSRDVHNESSKSHNLTKKDERDIVIRLEQLQIDLASQETLMLSGDVLDDETRELLKSALEHAVLVSKLKAKIKFNPTKNK